MTQIRESGKYLIGKSAWDIEGHWTQIYTTEFNTLGGTLFAAMSAIDIALWDIVGKKLGVPVYKLLGGRAIPARKSLRIYASAPWPGAERTRASYREKTKEIMAKGFARKADPGERSPAGRLSSRGHLPQFRGIVIGVELPRDG